MVEECWGGGDELCYRPGWELSGRLPGAWLYPAGMVGRESVHSFCSPPKLLHACAEVMDASLVLAYGHAWAGSGAFLQGCIIRLARTILSSICQALCLDRTLRI